MKSVKKKLYDTVTVSFECECWGNVHTKEHSKRNEHSKDQVS